MQNAASDLIGKKWIFFLKVFTDSGCELCWIIILNFELGRLVQTPRNQIYVHKYNETHGKYIIPIY